VGEAPLAGPRSVPPPSSELTTTSDARLAGPLIGVGALAVAFLRIGLGSFGGLPTTIALIDREFVARRGLLTNDDLVEAATYTRLLPGSGGPLIVSYLGFKLGGWWYSAVATICLLLPGVLLMLALAIGFATWSAVPQIRDAIAGLLAAVVGIQAVSLYRFARNSVKDLITFVIFASASVLALGLDVNAVVLVAVAGVFGSIALVPSNATAPDEK
jgi:chromate transporter